MQVSIIIPTLNEEEYLPKLLESIRQQRFKDLEIIVADAGSTDKTKEIAERYGCKIVPGGLPARGRNEGARVAGGELLVFLDADVMLPRDFLQKALGETAKRKLMVASVTLDPQRFLPRILFFLFYNILILLLERFLAHGAMCIFVKRSVFEQVGGFDTTIKFAEDHYFVRQARKISKFGILFSTKILVDTRRFRKDGWITTYLKCILCELHMIFWGPVRSDIFHYRFNHYHD